MDIWYKQMHETSKVLKHGWERDGVGGVGGYTYN